MICISIGNIDFESALILARDSQMIEIRQDLARFTFPEIASLTGTANRSIITCRPGFLSDERTA